MDEQKSPIKVAEIRDNILKKFKETRDKVIQAVHNFKIEDKESYTYKNNPMVKKALAGFMVVVMIGLGYTGYSINEVRTRAFDIYLDGDNLGPVRSEEEALQVFGEVRKDLCEKYDVDIVLDKELSFEASHAKDNALVDRDSLKKDIESRVGFLVSAYALNVNGQEIGVFRSEEEIDNLLDRLKEPYLDKITEESNLKEVKLVENVELINKEVSINSLSDEDKVLEYIKDGGEEIKTHIIEVGESFWTIARMYDTTVEELTLANEDKNPTKLKPGDEIKLLLPTSVITVETVAEIEYNEAIDYETQLEYDDSMYKNQQKVKVEGIKGERKVAANEIRHNGILAGKEIVKEDVLEESVDEVIIKGTKEIPKTMATGAFSMPTRGRISSRYGMRWGRMHKGLDIATSQGTAINAADAGKVSYAGWKGSFGYLVEIDHENGYKTRYAHCSKMHVSKGDRVYKGQHIANVGSTGRSTGAHLHFEVLKNGVNQNPSNYVK